MISVIIIILVVASSFTGLGNEYTLTMGNTLAFAPVPNLNLITISIIVTSAYQNHYVADTVYYLELFYNTNKQDLCPLTFL